MLNVTSRNKPRVKLGHRQSLLDKQDKQNAQDAKKAEQSTQNFEQLKASLDDSSDKNRNILIAFLVLQVYVFSATFSVTDVQLFLLDTKQSFSLFNFAIPMQGFFYVVPPVIFAFHFNLLINLRQHAVKLDRWLHHDRFNHKLHIDLLRPFIFNLWAKKYFRQHLEPLTSLSAVKSICWLLFLVFPLGLLVFAMWRLAALQSGILSTFHSVWVVCDILAIWHFWPKAVNPHKRYKTIRPIKLVGVATILLLTRATFLILTMFEPQLLKPMALNDYYSFVLPRLQVTGLTLNKQDKERTQVTEYDELVDDNGEPIDYIKVVECANNLAYQSIKLTNRNFNLIDLTGSTLCNVDFTRSSLQGANLYDARFSGKFDVANLRYADIFYTKFQRKTSFISADLSFTDIKQSIVNDVDFTVATINGARIIGSGFINSSFLQANMNDNYIVAVRLDYAEFVGTDLTSTIFEHLELKYNDFRLVRGLNRDYFEQGVVQDCEFDYQFISNIYTKLILPEQEKTRLGPDNPKSVFGEINLGDDHENFILRDFDYIPSSIGMAEAIWNTSNCNVLYTPKGIKSTPFSDNKFDSSTQDRRRLVRRLINANKLAKNRVLNLSNMNIRILSASLLALEHLEHLNLDGNDISSGALNEVFDNLTELRTLTIRGNAFNWLPESIGRLHHLHTLDLSNNFIPDLPESLFTLSNLKNLYLGNNKLSELSESIGQLKQLEYFDLGYNEIIQLPQGLSQLTHLQMLDLAGNRISRLPNDYWQLSKLRTLNLENNHFEFLPDAIGQLKSLTFIGLDDNQLTQLPESFGNLTKLTELDLSSNELKHLPTSFGQLNNLTRLELRVNKFEQLPLSTCNLTKLINLGLNNNKLTYLPSCIGNLMSLEHLSVYDNLLIEIPSSIVQLHQLKSLIFGHNQTLNVPDFIGRMNGLTSINMSGNKLTLVPDFVFKLINLNNLNLSYNQLSEIPASIHRLSRLESLSLHNNKLKQLPESIGQLRNLSSLNLEDNKLTQLPKSIGQLRNLSSLNLEDNELTQLPKLIGQLRNLASLNLEDNKLTQIPDSIGSLLQLQELQLDYNQLTTIPKNISTLKQLEILSLKENNIKVLPIELLQLDRLRKLCLFGNDLQALPLEFVSLEKYASFKQYDSCTRLFIYKAYLTY